jgi:hypothetical protein
VQALHNAAHDGDTITLPPGSFSWTSTLKITKRITLQGRTTISGAGTANCTAQDVTIIQDDISRSTPDSIISITAGRITGITFAPGASTSSPGTNGFISISGGSGAVAVRLDNCHFKKLYEGKVIWTAGWVYGVADHNFIEVTSNFTPFNFWQDSYGRNGNTFGNGAWADYPWFGTDKFFFVEDNTVIRYGATNPNSLADGAHGGRYVIRHNYVENSIPNNHGTEGPQRGVRAHEVYDNTFHITVAWGGGGTRSGTALWHDNKFTGVQSKNNQMCSLGVYRCFRDLAVYNQALGDNVWDMNDTEGNGTYVEGHAPYLFDYGIVSSWTNGTVTDTSKNWPANKWANYSIKNTYSGRGSQIISNTANTITYLYEPGVAYPIVFNPGDFYEIHRVLRALDQEGSGKGDLVRCCPPINQSTGNAKWPHQAIEPIYGWNNVYVPDGGEMIFHKATPGQPVSNSGVDFFNLGTAFPADTTPAAVSSKYVAALNGVDYVGPFVYPHPLVTAAPTPQPSGTQCFLLRQRLGRFQRRQQWLQRRHRSNPRLNRWILRLEHQLHLQHCT